MGIGKGAGLLLLILSFTFCRAQNVAGLWLGVFYPANPNQSVTVYKLSLTQTGNTVRGIAQTAGTSATFSSSFTFSGQLTATTLVFNETDQTGSTATNGVCYHHGTMTYNPAGESLIGTYENTTNATTCFDPSNGKMELYRIYLVNGSVYCKGQPINLALTGKNIRWYSSESKTSLLATGNTYTPQLTQTTTFYITQTLSQTESPVIPITITITEPIFKATPVSTGCDKTNGSIEVVASGAGGWQYKLNDGLFQSNPVFTSLVPGSYTVVAKDTLGCQAAQTVTISADAAPTITTLQTTPPQCASANGEVHVVAAGGKPPLTYSIDYGVTFQSSAVFTKLAGGSFTIRVRDANGCEVNKAVSLPPFSPMKVLAVDSIPTSCGQPNGQLTLTIAGGRSPVLYRLNNQPFQRSSLFTNLQAGTYTIQAKDSLGCSISQSAGIAASTGPQPADVQTTIANCGEQNGTIRIVPSVLATTVEFSIDGQSFQRSPIFSDLRAGNYTLTMQDDKNCVVTQPVQISLDCANRIHLPTAFSPNHDSINDALAIYFGFPALTITTFIVYDRWGAVLYNRTNFALSSGEPLWDGQINGQPAPVGVYEYQFDCLFPDGTPMTYRQSVALLH